MARKNITVVRQPRREIKPLGKPKGERIGDSPRIFDPLPSRTPLNVQVKIDGTPPEAQARGNFTTPFNLTPKVADEEDV
jgi:hypothetical protein